MSQHHHATLEKRGLLAHTFVLYQSLRDEKLVSAIKKAVYEYNGLTFSKPSAGEAKAIKSESLGHAVREGQVGAFELVSFPVGLPRGGSLKSSRSWRNWARF